ncbi:protein kinase, partial [Candidatus Bathyarchaeota archaeon]|nr:protein kinase [Candidatus Bathyarchaeota archaeon]
MNEHKVCFDVLIPLSMEPAHIEETGDMFIHSTSCFLYRKLPFKVLCYGEQIKICVDVAAKIRGRVFSSEAAVFRVLKELQICRFLQRNCHPNIVEYLGVARPNCLFDFNQVTILYRSYQLSLEVFINQKKERGESLNIGLLKAIMAGVLSALHHLHSHGIIHSNVKANSILLTENLEVKLAGLASCKISRDRHRSDCYRLNAREFGADPPELILGVPMVKGQPVDIFATGCLFYWLATGQPLFPCTPWVRDSVLLKVLQFQKLETVPTEEEIQRLELSVDWKYKMVEMRRKVLQERSFDSHGLERLFNDPGFCRILRCMLGFIASQRPTAERLLR